MSSSEELNHLHISFQHISSATNDFAKKNILGSGGFGKVYICESEKYGTIAVKRWDREGGERAQADNEFQTEIDFHSMYKHENIVSLLGFCDEDDEKILVYKYESNGSLAKCLWSRNLTWTQRLQICLGAARGLKYIHHDVTPEHRTIHRNVKSTNILLDEKWNAKISDFGLSNNGNANEQASFVISKASGTLGYTDPEYFSTGYLTQKSDVFSFGVILFEVLSGKSASVRTVYGQFFSVWVKQQYINKRLDEIIQYGLHEQINPASLLKFSAVAYRCLKTARERPTMVEVVEQLQKALDIQLAPSGASSDVYNDFTAANYYQSASLCSLSTAADDGPSISNNHDDDYGPIMRISRLPIVDYDDCGMVIHSSSPYTVAGRCSVPTDSVEDDYDTFELDYFGYQSYLSWLSSKSSFEPSPSSRRYDVFLSFRGQDTRMTFVKRLYSALVQQRVFKDELIPRGESIGPSLFKAIQESKIAIIIFSINYADSDWCLNELEYIMKCRAERGLVVIPVFYHVDPSVVRRQKQMYAAAFSKHELENIDKVESWRKALVDAANIAGFVVTGDEEKAIQEIVYTITHTYLSLIPSDNAIAERSAHTNLIGIEGRMQDLRSLLESGPDGVRMVGICGIWGGGKSALASSIYDEINHEFEGFCYVQNVRTESTLHGLKTLQEKILSDVFKSKVTLRDTNEGISMMTRRLSQNSVLIVLDDVDHVVHLNMLAASGNWFGDGSVIIITSRNQDLVKAHNYVTHNVRMLDAEEAIELFSWNAFGASRPDEGFEELAQSIVSKFGGHPATLKNLGAFLHGKDKLEWTSALARLEGTPADEILEKVNPGDDGVNRNTFSWLLTRGGKSKSVVTKMLTAGFFLLKMSSECCNISFYE